LVQQIRKQQKEIIQQFMKRAIILGISGQDGAYLAQLLLKKNYQVFGTMPDAPVRIFKCLRTLGIYQKVHLVQLSLQDFPAVLRLIKTLRPDEIYNLSSQVEYGRQDNGLTVCEPDIEASTKNVLEALRISGLGQRYLQVTSGEPTDVTQLAGWVANPKQRQHLEPVHDVELRSAQLVSTYRNTYGLFACSGNIYNRESPLQPGFALSRQITAAAARISSGYIERLEVPHPDLKREWGWAPEYATAMHRMLKQEIPADYVIASGEPHSIASFTEAVFDSVGLDWQQHVDISANGKEVINAPFSADPRRTYAKLGWRAEIGMEGVASLMVSSARFAEIL
jgi:GDPmannose 4,6-dehydratase